MKLVIMLMILVNGSNEIKGLDAIGFKSLEECKSKLPEISKELTKRVDKSLKVNLVCFESSFYETNRH